jgi:cell division protein FtsL
MCYAVAALAISAASAVAGAVGQAQQARATQDFQDQNSAAEQDRVKQDYQQLRLRQATEAESSARERENVQKAGRKQRATASNMAGESGVAGNSVDQLLQSYAAQEASIQSAAKRQAEVSNTFTNTQVEAARLGSSAQLANINKPVSKPNYIASALQIGSGAIDAAGVAKQRGSWWS